MSQTDTHHQLPTADVPKGTKLLIVRAPYYKQIGDDLLTGAEKAITDAGAAFETLDVPGALEIPTAISIAASSNKFDGFVALGCVIRGETTQASGSAGQSQRPEQRRRGCGGRAPPYRGEKPLRKVDAKTLHRISSRQ